MPAFGFAADLLKNRGASEAPESPAESAASNQPKGDSPPSDTPQATPTIVTESGGDAERIFAFADSLDQGFNEEQAAKVRLETWVTLTLADETFALPVEPVREILRISHITRVPHSPYPIRGVTNLRGRVIPVIDLRIRLELTEGELTRASRIIVVSSRGRLLGLLVDGVHQVVHLDADRVQPPPQDVMTVQSDYISGVYHMEDDLILLLNVDRALIIRGAPTAPSSQIEGADITSQDAGAV